MGLLFQVAGEFGFNLLDAWEAGIQRGGQGAEQLVFGHADGLVDAREGILGDESVLGAAEEQADGGLVVRSLDLGIHGTEVEIQLTGVFRLEGHGLQFHDDVAFQPGMVEKQVDEEFIPRHFQAKLATDEGKPCPQLQQKAGDVADEGVFDVALVGLIAKAQEIEVIGILEDLAGEPGLGRGETVFKVGHGSTLAEVELVLDLDGKGIAGPGLLKGFKGIPLAQFRRF